MNVTRMPVSTLALFALAVSVAALTLPALAGAATYAYVNTDGDVRTVTANDWMTAIETAPGRALRSGVMLLINPADSIVGDDVTGV